MCTWTYLAWVPRICSPHELLFTHSELAFGKFNPAASHHVTVHHKPNEERLIRLKITAIVALIQMF